MLRYMKGATSIIRITENVFNLTVKNGYCCKVITSRNSSSILSRQLKFAQNVRFCTTANTSEEAPSAEPNFSEITGGDPDLEHKLKVLILELEVLHQEGRAVPRQSSMKTENWKELLNLSAKTARRKYLEYLFKLEKKKENKLKKKLQKRVEYENRPKEEKDESRDSSLDYSLGRNQFFLRFYDSTMNEMYNRRLIEAMQFGQKLVVDCGFNEDMIKRENSNCAKQLMYLFAENRMSHEPFDLHYCNVDHESTLMKVLHKFIPPMYEPWFPLNFHEESYMDVFPKEKLVYLTPHCRDVLKDFDHDAIYIIGAIVDKVNNEPLTLAKAKKEGIRMAKLPLDYYLQWGSGSGKSLTINQVLLILADVKKTGNWEYSLRHVPKRKLADSKLTYAINKFKSRLSSTASRAVSKQGGIDLEGLIYNRDRRNVVSDKKENKNDLLELRKGSYK